MPRGHGPPAQRSASPPRRALPFICDEHIGSGISEHVFKPDLGARRSAPDRLAGRTCERAVRHPRDERTATPVISPECERASRRGRAVDGSGRGPEGQPVPASLLQFRREATVLKAGSRRRPPSGSAFKCWQEARLRHGCPSRGPVVANCPRSTCAVADTCRRACRWAERSRELR